MSAEAIFVEVIMIMKNECCGRKTERIRKLEERGNKIEFFLFLYF